MPIFGQDIHSMALPGDRSPLIKQGWARALLLLGVYIAISLCFGLLINVFTLKKSIAFTAFTEPALNSPAVQLWLTASLFVAIGCVWLFRKYIDRERINLLPWKRSSIHPDGTIGFLLGLALVCSGSLILFFTRHLQWTGIEINLTDLFIGVLTLMAAAVGEEWVFRGYILRNLLQSFNKTTALCASALLFTLAHSNNPDVHPIALVNIFLAGMITGLGYMQTRNLWFSILFHFSWNFFQGPVLGFPVSGLAARSVFILETEGNPIITGGNFGFEASVICAILLLLALTLWQYLKPRPSGRY